MKDEKIGQLEVAITRFSTSSATLACAAKNLIDKIRGEPDPRASEALKSIEGLLNRLDEAVARMRDSFIEAAIEIPEKTKQN
jgi:hypothetical protein